MGIGPLLPVLSTVLYPDFITSYVFRVPPFSGPKLCSYKIRNQKLCMRNFVELNGLWEIRISCTRSCCVSEKFREPPLFWAVSSEFMHDSWAFRLFLLYSSLTQYLENHAQVALLHHSTREAKYCSSVSSMVRARMSSHSSFLLLKYTFTASKRSWYTILVTLFTR